MLTGCQEKDYHDNLSLFEMSEEKKDAESGPKGGFLKPPRLPSGISRVREQEYAKEHQDSPVVIYIKPEPLPEDINNSCVYLSPEGTYHSVFGFIFDETNKEDLTEKGYITVVAVQVKIHGRVCKIFMSPDMARKEIEKDK